MGDSLALVLDAVTRADCDNVGFCFDNGHEYCYIETVKFTKGEEHI